MTEVWGSGQPVGGESKSTQLDRIEAKLDTLLAKKKTKPRASKTGYTWGFILVWDALPKRSGSNPKMAAFSKFNARIKEGADPQLILAGAKRYRNYIKAEGTEGTKYVLRAATFLGTDKHYENDWTIPKKKHSEDPDKQHHATFDPNAKVIIAAGVNPYAEDM